MRIVSRLRLISSATIAALAILTLVLSWTFIEFRDAKNDYVLASEIEANFYQGVSFRDQYFLYREERARVQWEKNKETADALLAQARRQFQREEERQVLDRLGKNSEGTATIFLRIVNSTEVLKTAGGNRDILQEFEKRLYGQLLLKAAAVRNSAAALENSSATRIEQTYRYLTLAIALFAFSLALVTLLSSRQIGSLIRKRLLPLHAGAKTVAGGDLDYRIPADGGDEFAELAMSINAMTDRLHVFTRQLEERVAERTQALAAANDDLARREALLKQILDTSSVAIFLLDRQGRITHANRRMAEMFRCPLETLDGREYADLVHPSERELARQRMLALQSSAIPSVDIDRRYWRADESEFWGHLSGKWFSAAGGEESMVGVIVDVTERKEAEDKLQLAASVFTHAREGIMITSPDGAIIDVNEAFSLITGYSHDEVLGRNPRVLSSGRQEKAFYADMWRELIEKGHWSGEVWNRRKNGDVYATMQTVSTVRDAQGLTQQYVALFSDITSLKEHEGRLEHLAHYDALTTLPNRVLLADRLRQAMAQAQRREKLLAVAYLDIDGFKAINDRHGHEVGDQLLIVAASRMKEFLREGDTLARLGGDEFVAVLLDLADVAAGVPMLTRLLEAVSQPVQVGDLLLQVSASIGVTFYPQAEVDADQLLRQADQAMYQAKLAGKHRFHFFSAETG